MTNNVQREQEIVRPNEHVLFEGMARVYDRSEADAYMDKLESDLAAAREQIAEERSRYDAAAAALSGAHFKIARLEAEKAQAFNEGVEAAATYLNNGRNEGLAALVLQLKRPTQETYLDGFTKDKESK